MMLNQGSLLVLLIILPLHLKSLHIQHWQAQNHQNTSPHNQREHKNILSRSIIYSKSSPQQTFSIQPLPLNFVSKQYHYVNVKIIKIMEQAYKISLNMKIYQDNNHNNLSQYYLFSKYVGAISSTNFAQVRLRIKLPKEGKYRYQIWLNNQQLESNKFPTQIINGSFTIVSIDSYTFRNQNVGIDKIKQNNFPLQMFLNVTQNKLILSWKLMNKTYCPIARLSFSQINSNVTLYISNSWGNGIEIPFNEFNSFQKIETNLAIACSLVNILNASYSLANINSSFYHITNIKFKAGQHKLQHIEDSYINMNTSQIKWKYNINEILQLKGQLFTTIQSDNKSILQVPFPQPQNISAAPFNPKCYFYQISVNRSLIIQDNSFTVHQKDILNQTGVYIFQILNNQLMEILNIPIYVGDFYPLIPDFQDNRQNFQIDKSSPIYLSQTHDEQIKFLLKMVNNQRSKWGISLLQLSDDLMIVAQQNVNNMVSINKAGHNSSALKQAFKFIEENETRRQNSRIMQNIVTQSSLENGHAKLCRSPSHYINIINPDQYIVGFGVGVGKDD